MLVIAWNVNKTWNEIFDNFGENIPPPEIYLIFFKWGMEDILDIDSHCPHLLSGETSFLLTSYENSLSILNNYSPNATAPAGYISGWYKFAATDLIYFVDNI